MNLENLWAWAVAAIGGLGLLWRKLKKALRRKKISASYQNGTAMLRVTKTKSTLSEDQEKVD